MAPLIVMPVSTGGQIVDLHARFPRIQVRYRHASWLSLSQKNEQFLSVSAIFGVLGD